MAKVKKQKLQWWWIAIPVTVLAVFALASLPKNNNPQSQQAAKQNLDNNTHAKISKEDAVAKVKALPEVIGYLKRVPNGLVQINGDENNSYMIQVYEIKDGHTATFNWYNVDKSTGTVEKQF